MKMNPTATEPSDPDTFDMLECQNDDCDSRSMLYEDYEAEAFGGLCPVCGVELTPVKCRNDATGNAQVIGRA